MENCLYMEICSEIKELVFSGKIETGGKVPSVNEIRQKHGVSHITALRVYKELTEQGIIEFRPGKGYFARQVKAEAPGGRKLKNVIAFVLRPQVKSNPYDNYFNDIDQAAQNEAMARRFNLLSPYPRAELLDNNPSKDALDLIWKSCTCIADEIDGYLLDERLPDSFIARLKEKTGKPMLLVNRTTNAGIDAVGPDDSGVGKAAEFCIRNGYGRFIVGRCMPQGNVQDRRGRADSFIRQLKADGVANSQIREYEYNRLPYEETFKAVESHLKGCGEGKALIFSSSDDFGRWITDRLVEAGYEVGKSVGVLSVDGLGHATIRKPHLTTMEMKPEEIGRMAVRTLAGRINGSDFSKPSNHLVPLSFKLGDTV